MISDILGILLAFIVQILLLSVLVTTLVQVTSSVFALRKRNFTAVFQRVLRSMRTEPSQDPQANALKIEEVDVFYSPKASKNSVDSFITPTGISWLSSAGLQRFLEKNPIELTAEQKTSLNETYEEIQLFMSKRFSVIIRTVTVAFSILIAFVFQANSIDMLKQLSTDDTYRQKMIAQVETNTIHSLYRASEESWEDALNSAIEKFAANNKALSVYVEQIDKSVITIAQAERDFLRILEGESVSDAKTIVSDFGATLNESAFNFMTKRSESYREVMNEGAKLNLTIWPDSAYFSGDIAQSLRRVFGIFITVILLSFGAPFWFKMLQNVAALRDLLTPQKTEKK